MTLLKIKLKLKLPAFLSLTRDRVQIKFAKFQSFFSNWILLLRCIYYKTRIALNLFGSFVLFFFSKRWQTIQMNREKGIYWISSSFTRFLNMMRTCCMQTKNTSLVWSPFRKIEGVFNEGKCRQVIVHSLLFVWERNRELQLHNHISPTNGVFRWLCLYTCRIMMAINFLGQLKMTTKLAPIKNTNGPDPFLSHFNLKSINCSHKLCKIFSNRWQWKFEPTNQPNKQTNKVYADGSEINK